MDKVILVISSLVTVLLFQAAFDYVYNLEKVDKNLRILRLLSGLGKLLFRGLNGTMYVIYRVNKFDHALSNGAKQKSV